jgi:hypothetical protein
MSNFQMKTYLQKAGLRVQKIALAILLATCVPLSATAHESHDKPSFGGIVTDAKELQLELVLKTNTVALHISDHGKPIDLKGATARITLLSGAEKTEINLLATVGKFEGKATNGNLPTQKGVKAVAVVTLAGKAPLTARFEVK